MRLKLFNIYSAMFGLGYFLAEGNLRLSTQAGVEIIGGDLNPL